MGQRNILCPSDMIDLEMNRRGHGYLHHEPCTFFGGIANYPPPDIPMTVITPGNTSSLDTLPLPEHYENGMFYGIPQFPVPSIQHCHHSPNLDLGIRSASDFYIPYVTTSSSGIHINRGPIGQMPSFSNHSLRGVSADEYARNCHVMDNFRASYKRKNFEGIPGNFQHFNASSSLSSSVTPFNTRHPDGVGPVDASSFTVPPHRGNDLHPISDAEPQRSVRNRLGATAVDPVLMHSANHFLRQNYMGQSFQPTMTAGSASAWTQAPSVPYVHGGNFGGPIETRHRANFSHSSLNLRNHNYHHPATSTEGVRNQGIYVHPQVAAAPYRIPTNYALQSTLNPSEDGLNMGHRNQGPIPPTGFRIYHSCREGVVVPETTLRYRNLPHLRVLAPDGVAMLEFPEFYEDAVNAVDHHRDMRLDIEEMSYEELLALGERIGSVKTGLSEETIMSKLKTRTYSTFVTNINLEEAAPIDQEPNSCIICQEDYKNQEKIGTLDCGHEYHAGCLSKWLFVKNVCPICKSEVLATKSEDV